MHLALIADTFPPRRNSGAVQLRDLSRELVAQGHRVTMLIPEPDLTSGWKIEDFGGVEVVRLKTPSVRHSSNARRAIAELLMPFWMHRNFRASPARGRTFDAIVWYSPTIFLGPLVRALKRQHRCRTYLIIRDIFPEWLADMGLMRRGPAYRALKAVANFQYSLADIVGIQTEGNGIYFTKWQARGARVEVLQNWLAEAPVQPCPIDLSRSPLAGRRIFVYAGNMGVAQGMDKLISLAAALKDNTDIGFVFVGRGTDAESLRARATQLRLTNTLFFDEIEPDQVPGLYVQCSVGLVALDARHKTHNIPGKFISYMHAGLPVLASVNPGNDLVRLVNEERVGRISTDMTGADLPDLALAMANDTDAHLLPARCQTLARQRFSAAAAATQIVAGIRS